MLSKQLAEYTVEKTYDHLTSDTIEFTKQCILDWLGSALAGASQPPVQILHEFIDEMGGKEHSSLVTGGKTSVYQAAFVNGASSHIVELDDIHRESIVHAGTVVIPAAVAVAEYLGKTGKDLITAVVVGYEIAYRIGEAVSPSHYEKWHNTATCGTFGAAAAAAKLFNLSVNETIHAIGSAGTQAAGLWEFIEDGAMSKQLHPAKSAMEGVLSALISQKGFTAANKILEGDRGFMYSMSAHPDETKITEGLGETEKIKENSFKIHASCRHTHQPIDIALSLLDEEGITHDQIDKIKVRTYQAAQKVAGNPNPKSVYGAKFSISYCTSLAFVYGNAGLTDFNEDRLHEPAIRNLMDKVEVIVDEEVEKEYPKEWGTKMEVYTNDGMSYERAVKFPKGDPENPVSLKDIQLKFKKMLEESGIGALIIDGHIDRVAALEKEELIADWFVQSTRNIKV
ncbi:hypothetical protein JCM19037_3367 [Geomicrobium sp. JCM 19037]|uniref:MmgE/PrpD family protein n=1 Tax=unclassified Geomicrobium TaxID=2628951 RepID=UPI00045F1E80|nr:MmgE/PrpD family protein [Geomicrobium sp. JCM 19037]GAK04910.1 hypothetical protein JCM19037_3367 [Geomicrobium sp. JCM 19037]